MSSEEEDLDLNDDAASQLMTDDGGDMMDMEDSNMSVQNSPAPSPSLQPTDTRQLDLKMDPQLLTCQSYDCVPLALAVHTSPIFSLATTRCFRWVITGSEDGYIRKWDFFTSMNGKTSLTQAHRHFHVDSVVYAGVLSSWWENEEIPEVKPEVDELQPTKVEPKLSPAFSLDIHSEALWAVQGCENGNINLSTVRHEEGKCHHVLRRHTGPVSVLSITPDETGVISGSWDKALLDWDLNTGTVIRSYDGHIAQITSTGFQPIHPTTDYWNKPNQNIFFSTSVDGQCLIWDRREPGQSAKRLPIPERTPPWALSATWSADGSKIYVGRRNGTVDEYDFGSQKWIQSFRMPANSGPVSCVKSMPNGKHIVCASNDNIRIWNTTLDSNFTIKPDTEPGFNKPSSKMSVIPFHILPGHHSGTISHIAIDPTCKYMITTSGNRGWEGNSTNACLFYDVSAIL